MFTDRYITVPIKEYDTKKEEMMGKREYEDNRLKINPFEISEYKPRKDEELDGIDCVSVVMKSGSHFYVYLTLEEFENLLNKSCHTA